MMRSGYRTGKQKAKVISVVLAVTILLTACAGRAEAAKEEADTPKEAARKVMCALKELDFETFNAYTDNEKGTSRNFMGIPVGKEYKVFQGLLRPRAFEGRHYREQYRFAEKVVEELDWEMGQVRKEGGGRKARIEMTITNRDMADAMERYTLWVVEDAVSGAGVGAASVIGGIAWAVNRCDDDLIRFIDETERTWTGQVTVEAYQEEGVWKLKLSDEFIDAIMGNMDVQE